MRTASIVGVLLGSLACVGGLVACGNDDAEGVSTSPTDPTTKGDAASESPPADAGATNDPDGGGEAGAMDLEAPALTILTPREDVAIAERRFEVTGIATDDVGVTKLSYVVGSGAPITVPVAADGSFSFTFVPAPGKNTVEVTAVDASGKQTKSTRSAWFGHRISAGNSQAAMLADGKLFTWGRNELGQLGNGTLTGTWSADETVVVRRCTSRRPPTSSRS